MKNLLAILKQEHESNALVADFLKSLPAETERVLNSIGYIGDLKSNLKSFRKQDRRHFAILLLTDIGGLAAECFAKVPETPVIEIPDRLNLKINIKVQDSDFKKGVMYELASGGPIASMIRKYEGLSLIPPERLLVEAITKYESFRKNITKKRLFSPKKRKLLPTYVSLGLETPDSRYLLTTTGANGPYVWRFNI